MSGNFWKLETIGFLMTHSLKEGTMKPVAWLFVDPLVETCIGESR